MNCKNFEQTTLRMPMDRRIYHMKSVCGGGKSYSMLEHIRSNLEEQFIYAVPTLALADQIERDWAAHGKEGDNLVRIDSTTTNGKRLEDLEAILCNGFLRQTVLITHKFLLDGLLKGLLDPCSWLGERIGEWHIVVDESPSLIEEHHFPDSANAYPYLSEIAKGHCIRGKFAIIEVNDQQRQRLAAIVKGSDNDTKLASTVRSLCSAIADGRLTRLQATPNGAGYYYYGSEFKPFAEIVDRASRVTILASSLTGFTNLYLHHFHIRVVPSPIKPRHESYPAQLQTRITVNRVFKVGNMSLERLKHYGTGTLLDVIADRVPGNFLVRANESQHKEAKGRSYVIDVTSKITNGLNAYINETALVDIASYNSNSIVRNAYVEMDALLCLPVGAWEAALCDSRWELSAQAAFRIGIRDINRLGATEFIIVLPDAGAEDYVRANYLPYARYEDEGWIVDDGKTGLSTGRPKGKSTITAAKVAEVQRLIVDAGMSVSRACKAVGISRTTFTTHTAAS